MTAMKVVAILWVLVDDWCVGARCLRWIISYDYLDM